MWQKLITSFFKNYTLEGAVFRNVLYYQQLPIAHYQLSFCMLTIILSNVYLKRTNVWKARSIFTPILSCRENNNDKIATNHW